MSQLSFSSFDSMLLVCDAQGRYLPASADQILSMARQVVVHFGRSPWITQTLDGRGASSSWRREANRTFLPFAYQRTRLGA